MIKNKLHKSVLALTLAGALVITAIPGTFTRAFAEEDASAPTAPPAVTAPAPAAPAANYVGTVNMAGQYSGGDALDGAQLQYEKVDAKQFNAATDKLGRGAEPEGSIRHLKTNFVGWSNMAPVNGEIAPGAKIYSEHDTVATAFPAGLTGGETLYAIYVPLRVPTDSGQAFQWFLGGGGVGLDGLVNSNTVHINGDVNAENTLPGTNLNTNETVDEGGKVVKKIIDTYKKKNDTSDINEIVLSGQFEMNKRIALLVHSNPLGQHWASPVLTKNYGDAGVLENVQSPAYTHANMTVEFGADVEMPEVIYLSFKAVSWRPIYAIDDQGNALEIVDPRTDAVLGNGKDAFNTLINNQDSEVLFAVKNPNKSRTLTIRTIIRTGEEKIIPTGDANETAADKITSNMELNAIKKSEINAKFGKNFTDEELANKVVRISDANAREMAKQDRTVEIKGYIDGKAVANAGTINGGFINVPLAETVAITKVESEILRLGFKLEEVKVYFDENYQGGNRTAFTVLLDNKLGTNIPEDPTRAGYVFAGWNTAADGTGLPVDGETLVEAADTVYYGVWRKLPEPPVVESIDKEIFVGDALDLKDLITRVSDEKDSLTKDDVVIEDGGFDNMKPGKYTVTFTVRDSNGLEATSQSIVTVKEKSAVNPQNPEDKKPEVKPEDKKPEAKKPATNNAPATGDSSNLMLMLGLLIVSSSGALVVTRKRK